MYPFVVNKYVVIVVVIFSVLRWMAVVVVVHNDSFKFEGSTPLQHTHNFTGTESQTLGPNNIPEQACGGSGKISVVELLRRATAQPSDWGLKLRSCCMKSLHSIRATSAKCKSHRIWFCNRERNMAQG